MMLTCSRIVWVSWWDHAKTSDGWPDPTELKPVVRNTVGWVVKETDAFINLAMDQSDGALEYGFSIDKRMVITVRQLEEGGWVE